MRKSISILIISVLTLGLAPSANAAPQVSPGNSQGNGPCVTSGNSNSKVKSTKNALKPCTFNITFIGNGLSTVLDSSSLLGIPYGSSRTIYINEIDPVNWFLWYAFDGLGNQVQLNRTTSPISYTFINVISDLSIELVYLPYY